MSDKKRADADDIQIILKKLVRNFGWDAITEGDAIIGAQVNGQSVTLEPGGQLELSGAPLATLHETCAETQNHLYQIKTIAKEHNFTLVGLGFDPVTAQEDVPMMPKQRYNIMKQYMPKVGSHGPEMMFRSCTIQVNLDFESEADMVRKARTSLALQPVATALFANSPIKEGELNGFESYRRRVWDDVDPDRCGYLPFIFEEGFGFERYVDYALSVPMYFVYRDGIYHDATGEFFADFMTGNLRGDHLKGYVATMKDWEDHLTTIFPEIRLKRFLEMRGADGGAWGMICALPALWVGLLYDAQALDEAEALVRDWTHEDRLHMQENVAAAGLGLALGGPRHRYGSMQELAQEVLRISKDGLRRRGMGEEAFLNRLEDIARTGVSPAMALKEKFLNQWDKSIDNIFSEDGSIF